MKNKKMSNRNIEMKFTWITALLFSVLLTGTTWADGSQAQPNIVMVFIDDMGWADFSCYGNKDAQTPYIDKMAEEGIAFEQFYVNSPICSPRALRFPQGPPARWRIGFPGPRGGNRGRGMANWLDPKRRCWRAVSRKRATLRAISEVAHGRSARCDRCPRDHGVRVR